MSEKTRTVQYFPGGNTGRGSRSVTLCVSTGESLSVFASRTGRQWYNLEEKHVTPQFSGCRMQPREAGTNSMGGTGSDDW